MRRPGLSPLKVMLFLVLAAVVPEQAFGPAAMQGGQPPAAAGQAPAAAPPAPAWIPLDLFQVPEGLEITVWAASPALHNPTNIDIDRDGRIWVAEGVRYRSHFARQHHDPGACSQSDLQGAECIAMTLPVEEEGRVGGETKGGPCEAEKRFVHRSGLIRELRTEPPGLAGRERRVWRRPPCRGAGGLRASLRRSQTPESSYLGHQLGSNRLWSPDGAKRAHDVPGARVDPTRGRLGRSMGAEAWT